MIVDGKEVTTNMIHLWERVTTKMIIGRKEVIANMIHLWEKSHHQNDHQWEEVARKTS